jgi:sialate O-acetylesterase
MTLLPLVLGHAASAGLFLPAQLSDNMVLQQSTRARVWGLADPHAWISITATWTSEVFTAQANATGDWDTTIRTPAGSYAAHNVTFTSGSRSIILHNVLIGEVWLTAGQSNMAISFNGYASCPVVGSNEIVGKAAKYKYVRAVTMMKNWSEIPLEYVPRSWEQSSTTTTPAWSATSFHFARTLQKTLNVPIGVIIGPWGGARVQGFMPKDLLEQLGEDLTTDYSDKPYLKPAIMYNNQIYPVRKYTLKGFLWIQGESNIGEERDWGRLMAALVQHWRDLWGLGPLPWYIAIVAPYEYGGSGIDGALLREAQIASQFLIPNSGIVNTIDVAFPYERTQIHFANKRPVGQRYAWLALKYAYGFANISADSPAYERHTVNGSSVWCYFTYAEMGLSPLTDVVGLEIADASRAFVPAVGTVAQGDGGRWALVVSAPSVAAPVAVRYCFKDFQVGNLVNVRNLPVFPFRTDNWTAPALFSRDFWQAKVARWQA